MTRERLPIARLLAGPAWQGYCVRCGGTLRRRWWARGPLTPFPLCPYGSPRGCR